jgi:hypothetical protein
MRPGSTRLKLICLALALPLGFLSLSSYSGGITGQSSAGCSCHGSNNTGTLLTLTGIPAGGWVPGTSYTLTASVNNTSMSYAGFDLTASVGELTNAPTGTTISNNNTEIGHGTPKLLNSGVASWTFTWTAPMDGTTDLVIDFAGNAVNLDGTNSNDEPNQTSLTFSANTSNLPIELLSFAGRASGKGNALSWQVAGEEAGTVYNVERSTTGSDFRAIAAVKGTETKDYLYEDAAVKGTSYYRLHITSGSDDSYSSVIVIRRGEAATGAIIIAPQPATGTLVVSSTDRSQDGSMATVVDIQGRVMSRFVLSASRSIDVSGWAPGVYAVRLASGEVLRVVKQ